MKKWACLVEHSAAIPAGIEDSHPKTSFNSPYPVIVALTNKDKLFAVSKLQCSDQRSEIGIWKCALAQRLGITALASLNSCNPLQLCPFWLVEYKSLCPRHVLGDTSVL